MWCKTDTNECNVASQLLFASVVKDYKTLVQICIMTAVWGINEDNLLYLLIYLQKKMLTDCNDLCGLVHWVCRLVSNVQCLGTAKKLNLVFKS